MKEWTGEARTAEEAVARGLGKMGLNAAQVDVRVLGERSTSLLSLFGFRRVQVRLTERFQRPERGERPSRSPLPPERRGLHTRDPRVAEEKHRRSPEPGRHGASGSLKTGRTSDPLEGNRRHDRPQAERRPARPKRGQSPIAPRSSKAAPRATARPEATSPAAPPTFHPFIPPESLLAQWRDLIGWEDLSWEIHPVDNRRLLVDLKTIQGERLAGSGSRVLEAFEYLFNLVASGGDREKPWVSFRVAGFPTAEESRLVDQALFAAFQVRRTGKPFRMDPLPPAHRRAVHQTLANHPDVETFSEGEGLDRRVVVKPKEKGTGG